MAEIRNTGAFINVPQQMLDDAPDIMGIIRRDLHRSMDDAYFRTLVGRSRWTNVWPDELVPFPRIKRLTDAGFRAHTIWINRRKRVRDAMYAFKHGLYVESDDDW